jgi:hypothetical protein
MTTPQPPPSMVSTTLPPTVIHLLQTPKNQIGLINFHVDMYKEATDLNANKSNRPAKICMRESNACGHWKLKIADMFDEKND